MSACNQLNERCDLDVLEILREARRLIEAGWCQGATAKDADSRAVDPGSPNIVNRCASILRSILPVSVPNNLTTDTPTFRL